MPGANAVWKSAMGRAKYPKAGGGTRRATVKDGSGSLVNSNGVAMHLATTGPGSATPIGIATAEKRTYRPFAAKK